MNDIDEIIKSINNLTSLIGSKLDEIIQNSDTSSGTTSDTASGTTSDTTSDTSSDSSSILTAINDDLTSLNEIIKNINTLKTQLNLLKLNDYEALYTANCLSPLLQITNSLAITSTSIMSTTQLLNNSNTTKRKTSKIKRSEKTVYNILEQINCIYPILECRIYNFINNICNDK